MRDVRLLTLFKQHYLDVYNEPLLCQYSCLGYYDGFDVEKIDESSYVKTFPKKSNAPISEMWYATSRKVGELPGGYSSQNVGIFRCVSASDNDSTDSAEIFWDELKRMPFFAIGFLQIRDYLDYDNVRKSLERKWHRVTDRKSEAFYNLMVYCTYDNADLVVLLQGNDIIEMQQVLKEIEAESDILYMHTIIGISEAYLKDCKEGIKKKADGKPEILDVWKDTKCFIDRPIQNITMRMVTSGNADVLGGLKGVLEEYIHKGYPIKNYEKITYSYVVGHENLCLTLQDSDVKGMLALLLPGGFATHQNIMYENGIYNIATSIESEKKRLSIHNSMIPQKGSKGKTDWCRLLIQKYKSRLKMTMDRGEEGLASYYQAMIQTLITLDQYENFGMAKNIFYLLFPAFDMFDRQFDRALQMAEENHDQFESIKNSLCQFLGFVNSVIYHTIHTDQIYLMVPGYSGASFSIPIKLSLMYLWFIRKVSGLLNDSQQEYGCILTPEMESRPMTKIIDLGLPERDRLICVQLSQRTLYLPRYLMIIIAHEIGHYVGDGIRNRVSRLEHMIKVLAYFVAEGVAPKDYDGEPENESEKNIFETLKGKLKEEIQNHVAIELEKAVRGRCAESGYYVKEIKDVLVGQLVRLLASEGIGIHRLIWKLSDEMLGSLENDKDNRLDNMKYIYKVQRHFNKNREKMLIEGTIERFMPELIQVYQEVFSDMAAIAILECNADDFHEAFIASEGTNVDAYEVITSQRKMREYVADQTVFKKNGEKWINSYIKEKDGRIDMVKNMYNYVWMKDHLGEYAQICYAGVKEHVEKDEKHIEDMKKLRELFKLFNGQPRVPCFDIYNQITICLGEYMDEIDEIYKSRYS